MSDQLPDALVSLKFKKISAPNDEIETSNKDKTGPKIDIPGKLIAKNDQIVLSGKITDDSQISSVKIDNEPITLDSKGNFEIIMKKK